MANCTDVRGTFSFEKTFYEANKEIIDGYFEDMAFNDDYGFNFVEPYSEAATFYFEATGRWSMANILRWVLIPDSKQELAKKLLSALRNSFNNQITFDYIDYDPGMMWRVKEQAIIVPKMTLKPFDLFKILKLKTKELPTDEHSLIDADLEDGLDLVGADQNTLKRLRKDIIKPYWKGLKLKEQKRFSVQNLQDALVHYVDTDKQYQGGIESWHLLNKDELNDIFAAALKSKI